MTPNSPELQPLIDLIKVFDMTMATEGVDSHIRRRITNQLLFGNPYGDLTAMITTDGETVSPKEAK